ncbi:MAG: O-antigen ligase family protein [Candidatus Kerfeldbacteria bacterium]|nr:O-antigen ligase family protein [Candidatus Kerfeldbacteria bacterium]
MSAQPQTESLPYAVIALGIIVLTLPAVFTFQTDDLGLGAICILVGGLLSLWAFRRFSIPRGGVWTWWIAFLVFAWINTFFISRLRYISEVSLLWLGVGALVTWLAAPFSRSHNFLQRTTWVLLTTQALMSGYAISLGLKEHQRAMGLLYNANGLGGYLLWGVLVSVVLLIAYPKKRWIWVATAIVMATWIFTLSLTSFAAAVAPIGLIFWWRLKEHPGRPSTSARGPRSGTDNNGMVAQEMKRTPPIQSLSLSKGGRARRVLVGSLCLVLVAGAFMGWKKSSFESLITSQHVASSWSQRLEFNRVAWRMWQDRPWLGWGLGTYERVFPRYTQDIQEQPKFVHNLYAQLLAETGIIGLGLWLGVVYLVGRAGWRTVQRADENDRWLKRGWFAAWLAFTIAAGLDFSWYFPAGQIWWLVASGYFLGQSGAEVDVSRWQTGVRTGSVIAGLFLLVIGGGVAVAKLASDQGYRAFHKNAGDEAIQSLSTAVYLTHNPTDVQLLAQSFWLRRRGDDLAHADRLLSKNLVVNSDDYFLHEFYGIVLNAEHQPKASLVQVSIAYHLDQLFHSDFRQNYAMALNRTGQRAQALALLDQGITFYQVHATYNAKIPAQIEALRSVRERIKLGETP